jgi:tol-pal system protein YbgF
MKPFIRHAAWVLVVASTCSHAALFEDEEARRAILDLRQRIESVRQSQISGDQGVQKSLDQVIQIQRASEQETSSLRQSLLQLQIQIDSLKQDISTLRGEREQLLREINLLQRAQKDALSLVDEKLKSAEERMKTIDQRFDKLEPVTVQVDGLEFEADPVEKKEFDAALAIFRKGEFAAASASFASFLRKYPSSGYRPSALFWLGSAKYVTRDYTDAANQLRSFVSMNPNHVRVPEAMLTLANAQLEIKQPKEARKTLEDLVRLFPEGEASIAAQDRLSRMK